MKIGDKIKLLRTNKKISQKDLAKQLDMPVSTLANYENNHREPNIETIQKIAAALDVSINELIGAQDLTNENNEILDFLYDKGLIELRDIFKEFNYDLSDDKNGNILISKDKDIIVVVPEKDFTELGVEMLKHIREFHEFELNKLLNCYKFLY